MLSNVWYESYLRAFDDRVYPLKTTKTGPKHNQLQGCDLELKMELLKLLAIQSKIFEVNLLMKGRI